jgi:DNA-binding transcriptional MerR regulator
MLAIGEVARRAGVAPSALRYYERLGLLPEPGRVSGRRRYDEAILKRLRVIGFARECGFSLREIQQLFAGKPYSATLRGLAHRKLDEVAQAIERFHAMRELLNSALRCRCLTLEQCAQQIEARPPRRRAGA